MDIDDDFLAKIREAVIKEFYSQEHEEKSESEPRSTHSDEDLDACGIEKKTRQKSATKNNTSASGGKRKLKAAKGNIEKKKNSNKPTMRARERLPPSVFKLNKLHHDIKTVKMRGNFKKNEQKGPPRRGLPRKVKNGLFDNEDNGIGKRSKASLEMEQPQEPKRTGGRGNNDGGRSKRAQK